MGRSPGHTRRTSERGQSILEVLLIIFLIIAPVSLLLITFIIGNWNQTHAFASARNEALERLITPQDGWIDDSVEPCVTTKTAKWILFRPKNLAEFTTEVRLYQPTDRFNAGGVCPD